MSRSKDLNPEQIKNIAYLEGSLDTIYHALSRIYSELGQESPEVANYLIDAMGAIDSAAMAAVKMYDKR